MSPISSVRFCFLLLSAFAAASGCGKANPSLVPVSGRVTLDDKPLSEVVVTFSPIGATQGNGALGATAAEGQFTLTDVRGNAGVRVGEYRVSLYPTPVGNPNDDPADVVSTGAVSVPAMYLNPSQSPLRATVPPGGGTVEVILTRSGEGATTRTTAAKSDR